MEIQQRGAPHIHSVLWMKTADGKDAPGFWINADNLDENNPTKVKDISRKSEEKIKAVKTLQMA